MDKPEAAESYQLWEYLSLPDTLRDHATVASIRPHGLSAADDDDLTTPMSDDSSFTPPELAGLPTFVIAEQGKPAQADFDIRAELGRGGMGVVHRAEQRSLLRDVAIKRILKKRAHAARIRALIDEARVVGSLEHPSIVPIHGLGHDQNGHPMLVMQRIEGVVWRALIKNPDHEAWAELPDDRLQWHIQTLIKVCQAVEFAHSRGVLHRDIKPANVMIGGFGAVYLLDWGLASVSGEEPVEPAPASMTGIEQSGLPVIGTPAYMAPEMATRAHIDERSDVYLLGATLHEVLLGRPPHLGETFLEVIHQVCASEPFAYPARVPRQLAAICNKSRAQAPADRYQSARELRLALSRYLDQRSADRLLDEADKRLSHHASGRDSLEEVRQRQLLTEARFGIQQALEIDPGNERGQAALQRCIRAALALEIAGGNIAAAEALYLEVVEPGELSERLSALRDRRADKKRQVEKLERMAADADLRVLSQVRGKQLLVLCMVALVVAGSLLLPLRLYNWQLTYRILVFGGILQTSVLVIMVLLTGRFYQLNRVNRRILWSFAILQIMIALNRVIDALHDGNITMTLQAELLLCSLYSWMIMLGFDRRMRPPTVLCSACTLVALAWPAATYELLMGGALGGMFWAAYIWYRGRGNPRTISGVSDSVREY